MRVRATRGVCWPGPSQASPADAVTYLSTGRAKCKGLSSISVHSGCRRTCVSTRRRLLNHMGARPSQRFVGATGTTCESSRGLRPETRSVRGLADLDRTLLVRYVEWLGQQQTAAGTRWSKITQSSSTTFFASSCNG